MTGSVDTGAATSKRSFEPLADVRVLDFTQLLPGPVATQILADLGATVIKVERPGGDPIRHLMPGYVEAVNQGKLSIAIDLKHDEGPRIARRLAESCDVVVEGFRPGVAARLGVGADQLRAVKEDLIYCSLSGYGQNGPRRYEPGHDLNYLGLAGALDRPRAHERFVLGTSLPVADTLGGVYAACAIIAALHDHGDGGAHIDVSMSEAVLAGMAPVLNEHVARGRPQDGRLPARPAYSAYAAADGELLTVACTEDHFWLRLCDVLDLPALAADPELGTWEGRAGRAAEVDDAIAARLATRDRSEWLRILAEADVPAAPVLAPDEALSEPQFVARDAVTEQDGVLKLRFPALIDGRPIGYPRTAPDVGADTAAVLAEAGLEQRAITDLIAAKAVFCANGAVSD